MSATDFPRIGGRTSDTFASDVVADEQAIVSAIRSARQNEAVSLEEIGFLLGVGAGQVSRYLSGGCRTTLTNYLRIARALGYRCRITLEKIETVPGTSETAPDLRILPHRVRHMGRSTTGCSIKK